MNESQIFTNALKLGTPGERAAFLDRACAGDARLRASIEDLLRAQASDPEFLEQPAASLAGTVDGPARAATTAEEAGVVLAGRYRLVEEIGEGGMGTVWMARQTEPVKRLVAIKLLRPGMDSRLVLGRFEAERQALALMDHPNIAKVFDAGATPDRRPFFAMELVKGVPITQFCDDHRLTPRQRLELFAPVCLAVQHAHQKGVIHRDLKPSNVLVALYDDKPVPKIIDFGVAKATEAQLTEETLHTSFGAVVGTVEYMSPEQATFNQLDIDTRSDVYSLGVLLYELLTGTTPLDRRHLGDTPLLELLRIVREDDTVCPSSRLSTVEELPTIAASRAVEPKKLSGLVRGELDWIVMKALEKDRSRRYETAGALAADVARYLGNEPVQACPPSTGYRLRKFVRRNRGPVLVAGVVLLGLLAAIAGLVVSNVVIGRARQDAVAARDRAHDERDIARQVVEDMWVDVAEKWLRDEPGLEQTQRKFAQKALEFYERLAREEADNPDVQADVGKAHFRVAVIHDRLGALDRGADAYRQAADVFGRLADQDPGNPEYRYWQARSLAERGELCDRAGRRREAEDLARQALGLFEKATADFPDDARVPAGVADCCVVLGSVNIVPGPRLNGFHRTDYAPERRWTECLRLLRRALDLYPQVIARETGRSDHRWRFHRAQKILSQLPGLPWAERERLTRESLAGFEALIKEFPREHRPRMELSEALVWSGVLFWFSGRPEEEEVAYRRALDIADQLVADYREVPYYLKLQASVRYHLGARLASTDQPTEAERLLAQAAKALEAVPAGLVPPVELWHEAARCHEYLGNLWGRAGRWEEADQAYREALALDLRVARDYQIVATHYHLHTDCKHLIRVGPRAGRADDAVRVYRDVAAAWGQLADAHPTEPAVAQYYTECLNNLGVSLRTLGRLDEADRAYAESQAACARLTKAFPGDPWFWDHWAFVQENRAALRQIAGRPDEAADAYRQRVDWFQRRVAAAPHGPPSDRHAVPKALAELGAYLDQLGRPSNLVKQAYREAIAAFDRLAEEVPDEPGYRRDGANSRIDLAFALQRDGKPDQANLLADEAVALRRAVTATGTLADRIHLAAALADQGLVRWSTNRAGPAAAARDEAAALLEKRLGEGDADADTLTSMADVSALCARLFEHTGKTDKAEAAYARAAALRERRARDVSDNLGANVSARVAWAGSLADLGRFRLRQGHADPAAHSLAEARDAYAQVAASFPREAKALHPLALFLAACPVESLRDPARAVRVAERAAHLNWEEEGFAAGARGVARYRLGEYPTAVADVELATLLNNGEVRPEYLFVRAMARWRLGETNAARRDYGEAVRLMALDEDRWSELEQFRREAAAVLGVK